MGQFFLFVIVFFTGLLIITSIVGLIIAIPALALCIYQNFFEKDCKNEDDD